MDLSTAKYMVHYFPSILTENEGQALRHSMFSSKLDAYGRTEARVEQYRKLNWLSDNPEVLNLLKDGIDALILNAATRAIKTEPAQVFLNNCPKCGLLAFTPAARQCKYCGHDWHHINVAQFKWNSTFQSASHGLLICGNMVRGKAEIGNYIDMTMCGLPYRSRIDSIQILNREETALGIDELSEAEKERVKKCRRLAIPIDVIKER